MSMYILLSDRRDIHTVVRNYTISLLEFDTLLHFCSE